MSIGAINHNLMAVDAAGKLNSHYSRLSISTQRLATGLRINSAADDAAGLAIRELMRSDIAASKQGMRNANDAISMLQVADGALAVIDEKLIRMKELAEQAATGTYDSTQRLMIDSEYRAMADEIDRIARATDFNGIKLLDGSLAGNHDGSKMQASGRMKIHFGSGNDSAEDYYYVEIGNCTTGALGLGTGSIGSGPNISYTEKEYFAVEQKTFSPKPAYDAYEDPDTGRVYYTDGTTWFENPLAPARTMLDWEKDADIIEKLRRKPATLKTIVAFNVYEDTGNPGVKYYSDDGGKTYTANPHDEKSIRLDPANAADKVIIDRLQRVLGERVDVETHWYTYKDANDKEYYTCDGGITFVPDPNFPKDNVLDSNIPAHLPAIKALEQVFDKREMRAPAYEVKYTAWRDPDTWELYLSPDGGKTLMTDPDNPSSMLDPIRDALIIARLVPEADTIDHSVDFDTYVHALTGVRYYTMDNGKTFYFSPGNPSIAFRADDPNDLADIANLSPVVKTTRSSTRCEVYEDTSDNNKRYYTKDRGQTFFTDINDPTGSALDRNDPGYAALVANFQKTSSTVTINVDYAIWQNPDTNIRYYTCDGGMTFITNLNFPDLIALDASNASHLAIIGRLQPQILQSIDLTTYMQYVDPVNNQIYYTSWDGDRTKYITDLDNPDNIALDVANPADKSVIDRLKLVQKEFDIEVDAEFPDKLDIYRDPNAYKSFYYSFDGGNTFTSDCENPYDPKYWLDPDDPADKAILDRLRPEEGLIRKVEIIGNITPGAGGATGAGATISTQQSAQEALVAIDRAIVSKDKIRAHLGALQNRLENTVTNLGIQAENLQVSESRISDTDVAMEMTQFVRNQILTQSAVAMLGQANSFPHMMSSLING